MEIKALFHDAVHFEIAVAFVKLSGFKQLKSELHQHLLNDMTGRMFVGLDFFQTDPKVLEILIEYQNEYKGKFQVYISNSSGSTCFHPKVYCFEYAGNISISVIGSANLTHGGLLANRECSIIHEGQENDGIKAELTDLFRRKLVVKLNKDALEDYSKKYYFKKIAKERVDSAVNKYVKNKEPGIKFFDDMIKRLKKNAPKDRFSKMAKERKKNAASAKKLIITAVNNGKINATQVADLQSRFHSGMLDWHLNKINKNLSEFYKVLNTCCSAYKNSPADAWRDASMEAIPISGVGPNWVSEILHALDPSKYAILNRNSVSGMLMLNKIYPATPGFNNIKPDVYAAFCQDAVAIAKKLHLQNLSELDMIFNEAYWNN